MDMTDLHARFRSLDGVPAPDLWEEVTRRAEHLISTESVPRISIGRPTPVVAARLRISWTVVIVVAALVFAVLSGGVFIAGALNPKPSATVAPSPTVVPSPTIGPSRSLAPSQTVRPSLAGLRSGPPPGDPPLGGPLDVHPTGRYILAAPENDFGEPLQVVATVPSGWRLVESARGGGVEKLPGQTQRLTLGRLESLECGPTSSPTGQTVEELTANLADLPGVAVTDLVIDGYAGKRVELTVTADSVFCRWRSSYYLGWQEQLSIFDINGTRFVIVAGYAPGTTASDQAELQAIVDSIELRGI